MRIGQAGNRHEPLTVIEDVERSPERPAADQVESSSVREILFHLTPEAAERGAVGPSELVLRHCPSEKRVALDLGVTTEREIEELRRELVSMSDTQLGHAFEALKELKARTALSGPDHGEDWIEKLGGSRELAGFVRAAVATGCILGSKAAAGISLLPTLDFITGWHTPQHLYAVPLVILTVIDALQLRQNVRQGGSNGRVLQGIFRLASSVLGLAGNLPLSGYALMASFGYDPIRKNAETRAKNVSRYHLAEDSAALGPKLKAIIQKRAEELDAS